jgi:peptidyl-prolyl cis-trans isomerase-like protein 2
LPDNATNFTTGRASAALTSTAWAPQIKNERELLDEEECQSTLPQAATALLTIDMFEELKKPVKDKDRLKSKAYATIMTNFGGLNLELHGDRAPKTVYNFVMLAKQGYYDDTIFHRLIPGFMVCYAPRLQGER